MSLKLLYPPRAEVAINPDRLAEHPNMIAQFKYNDIRTVIYLLEGGDIEIRSRHREPLMGYRLSNRMRQALHSLKLPKYKNHALDGGILRTVASPRGERPIVLWDILVYNNQHLLGTTYKFRYELLERVARHPTGYEEVTGERIALEIKDELWLAPTFTSGFEELFRKTLPHSYLEGLVLKDPNGRLETPYREHNNTSWMIKARKPRADYQF